MRIRGDVLDECELVRDLGPPGRAGGDTLHPGERRLDADDGCGANVVEDRGSGLCLALSLRGDGLLQSSLLLRHAGEHLEPAPLLCGLSPGVHFVRGHPGAEIPHG